MRPQSPRGNDYLILAKRNELLTYHATKSTPVHHADKVNPEEFLASLDHLRQQGVKVFNIEDRNSGVFWRPQAYLLDPDSNKLESMPAQALR